MSPKADLLLRGVHIEALIGTGSVGEVWRARRTDGSCVALKRMLPHAARHEASVAAFEREARLYQRFDCTGVPRCFGHGRDDRGPYLLLEYVDGTTLAALIGEPVPPRLALRVVRDVLAVLETVHTIRDDDGHALGLVHRDLSPSNVLIAKDGTVKLADFGIARTTFGTHATTGVMAKGTLGYMSPEQARGEPLDARSDLFAVGALLHEMLTGRSPYDEQDARLALARARAGDVQPFEVTMPEADRALADLIDQALSAEPVERFVSAARMRDAVEAVAQRLGGLATNEAVGAWASTKPRHEQPVPEPASRPTSNRGIAIALALMVLVGAGGSAWWWQSRAPVAMLASTASAAAASVELPEPDSSLPNPTASEDAAPPPTSTSSPLVRRLTAPSDSRPATAEAATLDIGSTPSFAYVTIDGRRVGATPLFGLKLTPGVHTITVERAELGAKTLTIELQPGERARRVVTLP